MQSVSARVKRSWEEERRRLMAEQARPAVYGRARRGEVPVTDSTASAPAPSHPLSV